MAAPQAERKPLPSRNPLFVSSAQEAQIRETYYQRVRGHCADEIRDFAACATGRTLTISWACQVQRLAMNSCMNSHATREEQDAAREEWFANMGERKRLREEKEKKKKEQEKFHREWWGLPPLPDEEESRRGQTEDGKR